MARGAGVPEVRRVTMLAIPEPTELVVARVHDLCTSVEEWAEAAEDIGALRDAGHKLDALAQYLAATTTEGTNRMRAAKLRLEARVGILLGEAELGRPRNGKSVTTDISRHERSDFRQMAANPEAVEAAIAEGTDEEPVSRRKVMAKISTTTTSCNTSTLHDVVKIRPRKGQPSVDRTIGAVALGISGWASSRIDDVDLTIVDPAVRAEALLALRSALPQIRRMIRQLEAASGSVPARSLRAVATP